MNVLIRADASLVIGSGHIMRCLTLADQLRTKGMTVAFVCRNIAGSMFDLLSARGYQTFSIDGNWSQQFDAEETIKIVSQMFSGGLDWLVVDHYELDAQWERMLRPHVQKLFVIDDLANRFHDCDLLLDQNYENSDRYSPWIGDNCQTLLGPCYALIRPEYAALRMTSRRELVNRVLVFFGGSDPDDLTGMALEALSDSMFVALDVDVVIGSNYFYHSKLEKQVLIRGKTTIHRPQPHLANLMAVADISIGAGGATNWERMCLGLPSIVITLADNQVPISKILHRKGALRLIGSAKEVTVKSIRDALIDEIFSNRYSERVTIALAQCDGLGLNRVVEAMHDFRNSFKSEGEILNSN